MAQNTLIPGLQPNQYTNVATVASGGSIAADFAQGLSTVVAQTQSANPGVGPPLQGANQQLTTLVFFPAGTLAASAPGLRTPQNTVTQAS